MKTKKDQDKYMAHTPKNEIEVCRACPYPEPKCGANGCEHFKRLKAEFLKAKGDRRRLRGKKEVVV